MCIRDSTNYGVDYQNGGTCHFNPIPDTWNKMLDILMFWAEKHIDGFRFDGVTSMLYYSHGDVYKRQVEHRKVTRLWWHRNLSAGWVRWKKWYPPCCGCVRKLSLIHILPAKNPFCRPQFPRNLFPAFFRTGKTPFGNPTFECKPVSYTHLVCLHKKTQNKAKFTILYC